VIPKASYETIRSAGLQRFRDLVDKLSPFAAARAAELRDWNDVSLLTVRVDRLRQWHRPGLLCIGDAAHAMSPIGGVGINLAIQDAVAAANLLAAPLRDGRLTQAHLHAVQRRRMLPTRVTQGLQLALQKRVVGRVLAGGERLSPPLALRLLAQVPFLRRLPARLIGLGVRPEHVTAPLILQAESD
jgi:2-polyprenyl-6-methoxyphenol hydroxylase-like FAD-dependent oxidoreductase